MENKAHALIAGTFTLLLLVATLAAIWWFGGKREAVSEYLVVTRQNVTGLNLQAQVRYRGIRVGRVESVQLDPEDARDILIRITIARDVPVTQGTIAKLGYQGLTGIAHVLLEDTGKNTAELARGDKLPRIPMQPSLMQEFADSGGAVLRQANELLTNVNQLLNAENRSRISKTLANLETGSANLTATLAEAKAVLADDRIKRLGPAIANIEGAAGETRNALREAGKLLPHMISLTEKLDQMVGETNGEGLAASSARMQELGRELTLTSRQLNRLLQMLEAAPQSIIYGPPSAAPGPGEPGFVPFTKPEKP
ncbi:MAG: MCE family protein [Betaproteobacteria bacterium]|nr:MCE family protein [Betaproteobacteria bacterium]